MTDAPRVHRKPIVYFNLETFVVLSEPAWIARSDAEMVRRNKELRIRAVNFWELRKNEKTALKPNWVAHRRE